MTFNIYLRKLFIVFAKNTRFTTLKFCFVKMLVSMNWSMWSKAIVITSKLWVFFSLNWLLCFFLFECLFALPFFWMFLGVLFNFLLFLIIFVALCVQQNRSNFNWTSRCACSSPTSRGSFVQSTSQSWWICMSYLLYI